MAKKNVNALVAQVAAHDDFGQFRFIKKDNGEIWFVAVDICKILGYKNSRKAVSDHVEAEDKKSVDLNSVTNRDGIRDAVSDGWIKNEVTIINESGLYSLIFGSQLPTAKKFKRWVTSEVLPSIRKHGFYALPQEETVTLQIKGAKNLSAFKEKYPNIKFSEKAYLIGTYFEDGVENEETFIRYDLTVNLNDYKKIEQKHYSQLFISN